MRISNGGPHLHSPWLHNMLCMGLLGGFHSPVPACPRAAPRLCELRTTLRLSTTGQACRASSDFGFQSQRAWLCNLGELFFLFTIEAMALKSPGRPAPDSFNNKYRQRVCCAPGCAPRPRGSGAQWQKKKSSKVPMQVHHKDGGRAGWGRITKNPSWLHCSVLTDGRAPGRGPPKRRQEAREMLQW